MQDHLEKGAQPGLEVAERQAWPGLLNDTAKQKHKAAGLPKDHRRPARINHVPAF